MTSTRSRTMSAASAGNRCTSPSAKRYDDDILANAVTETSQALFESFNEMKLRRLRPAREVPHPVDSPCGLLRARSERRTRRRAAEQRDELAPLHVRDFQNPCPPARRLLLPGQQP